MSTIHNAQPVTASNERLDKAAQPHAVAVAARERTQMQAIVLHRYGSPELLEVAELPKPTPQANEVLIKIYAASVNAGDWHLMRGDPFLIRLGAGLRRPKTKILGADIAGRVEAVGSQVTQFQVGDEVFGDISGHGFGAFAAYVAVPAAALVRKPAASSFVQAAAIPAAATTALQGLRDHGKIQPGQKVLINGASGGVGTFAVQIAKALGAEVTGVCSTGKMALVRSLGADHVIDYTQEDFTQNGQRYDLILAVGGTQSLADYKRALAPNGRYVMIGGSSMAQFYQAMFLGPWHSLLGSQKMSLMMVKPNPQDLTFLKELVETGKVVPVVDKAYTLSEVPAAIRYVEAGRAQGKVIIDMVNE